MWEIIYMIIVDKWLLTLSITKKLIYHPLINVSIISGLKQLIIDNAARATNATSYETVETSMSTNHPWQDRRHVFLFCLHHLKISSVSSYIVEQNWAL